MNLHVRMSKERFSVLVFLLFAKGCTLEPQRDDPALGIVGFPDVDSLRAMRDFVGIEYADALLVERSAWKQFGGASEPDYRALVDLLPNLQRVPDASGGTELTGEEAAVIREMGFSAETGPWTVPPLPDDLVAGDGLLECLSESWRWAEEGRPAQKTELVDTTRLIRLDIDLGEHRRRPPLTQDETRVLRAVTHRSLPVDKRRLQQLLWRIGAERFNVAFESLLTQEILAVQGHGVICQRT